MLRRPSGLGARPRVRPTMTVPPGLARPSRIGFAGISGESRTPRAHRHHPLFRVHAAGDAHTRRGFPTIMTPAKVQTSLDYIGGEWIDTEEIGRASCRER